jgi:hypothetical protein
MTLVITVVLINYENCLKVATAIKVMAEVLNDLAHQP